MPNRFNEQFIAKQLSDISSIHRYGAYRGAGGRAPPYQRSPLLANGATLHWRFRAPLQVGIHCDCFILGKILLTCKPKPPVARAESAHGYAAEGLTKGLARPRTKKRRSPTYFLPLDIPRHEARKTTAATLSITAHNQNS